MTMQAIRYKGQPIAKSGAYFGVPIEDYHSGHLCDGWSVSSSSLKRMLQSPAHYWAACKRNPEREPEERSDALDMGAAAHCAALEPEKFAEQFVVSEYDDFRSKEARAWREAARGTGKIVLTEDQHRTVKRMAARLAQEPEALALFRDGLPELTFAHQDEHTGLWLLARPDFVPADPSRGLVDYKTARTADPGAWSRQAFDLAYPLQAALALHVVEKATGEKRPTFWFVVQESASPHVVTTLRLEPEQIAYGRQQMRDALDRLARCIETGRWPGYVEGPTSVVTPRYLSHLIEEAA